MSKKNFQNLTMAERAELASQVKEVRRAVGMTQQDLADAAKVTRQSIGNIETGGVVPQMKTLAPILEVLGLKPQEATFDADVNKWLAIVGGMMTALPVEGRARAGQAAVNAVAQEIVLHSSNVGGSDKDGSPEDEIEIPEDVQSKWDLAAHEATPAPQDHTP